MLTASTPAAARQDTYFTEKATHGGVTFVKLHGTLDEAFVGRKLASSLRTKKVVLHMHDVRRFASFGMAEWMHFLRLVPDHDIYIVECSMYALSQLSLVTGLMGHAKLVSFYASYRCISCTKEIQALFLLPRDRESLRDLADSQRICTACGGHARLEEYPSALFETIASRQTIDIDDDALAFMRSQLNYDLAPDQTRFRAFRRTHKQYTYIRLSGSLATLPSEALLNASRDTTVLDLAKVAAEPGQLSAWRNYLAAVSQRITSLQLAECPPGFLETALRPDDLRDKVAVRTFGVAYQCGTCGSRSTQMIDVAANLEELVQGTLPQSRCSKCRSSLVTNVSLVLSSLLRALPARDRNVALDRFLAKASKEPQQELENCLVGQQPAKPNALPEPRRTRLFGLVLAIIVAGGAVAVAAATMLRHRSDTSVPMGSATATPVVQPRPTFQRPDWIVASVPGSAYCHDMINRLMCVGVSSYHVDRDDGVAEATDAALEELVSTVGLKISDPVFKDSVIREYSDIRGKALSAYQAADFDRPTDSQAAAAFTAAADVVRKARARVVQVLHASGGAAVPAQRSDWYWEEYESDTGTGHEFLVFVRFDVPLDAVRALVEEYSSTTSVLGSTVMTAFPSLAWHDAHFKGGAYVTKVAAPLASAGLAPQQIVNAVDGQPVADAETFAKRVEAASGELQLTVDSGAAGRVIRVRK